MLSIKISGIDAVMRDARSAFDDEIEKGVRKTSAKIVRRLQEATPVDTGEARSGWSVLPSMDRKHLYVTNPVEHIARLNDGTSRQAAPRFIEKTILSISGLRPAGSIIRYNK